MKTFVSYSSEDAEHVTKLVKRMERLGHQVWIDRGRLVGGQMWWDEILENLRRCDTFVFAVSPNSISSGPCRAELAYADELRRPIVPVVVGPVSPGVLPPTLAHVQHVDYTKPSRKATGSVRRALSQSPQGSPLPQPLPAPPPVPEPPLYGISERLRSPDPLSVPEQQQLCQELSVHGRQRALRADCVALLGILRQRPELRRDMRRRVNKARTQLRRTAKGKDVPAWGRGFVVGMMALSLFLAGVPSLLAGLWNVRRPQRRLQAALLVLFGFLVLAVVVGASLAGHSNGG